MQSVLGLKSGISGSSPIFTRCKWSDLGQVSEYVYLPVKNTFQGVMRIESESGRMLNG